MKRRILCETLRNHLYSGIYTHVSMCIFKTEPYSSLVVLLLGSLQSATSSIQVRALVRSGWANFRKLRVPCVSFVSEMGVDDQDRARETRGATARARRAEIKRVFVRLGNVEESSGIWNTCARQPVNFEDRTVLTRPPLFAPQSATFAPWVQLTVNSRDSTWTTYSRRC